ncbi:hypothetical protein [Streptomyces sp. NPDC003247]|uniref:hypothetical protein n=1 Tax=Streptomyces sp. NPDC003247 TaxID=3364677 RepID=UPI0036845015
MEGGGETEDEDHDTAADVVGCRELKAVDGEDGARAHSDVADQRCGHAVTEGCDLGQGKIADPEERQGGSGCVQSPAHRPSDKASAEERTEYGTESLSQIQDPYACVANVKTVKGVDRQQADHASDRREPPDCTGSLDASLANVCEHHSTGRGGRRPKTGGTQRGRESSWAPVFSADSHHDQRERPGKRSRQLFDPMITPSLLP